MKYLTIAATILALSAGAASAATYTYDVNLNVGIGNVSGFIETDGTLGILETANIIDWTFTLSAPNTVSGFDETFSAANRRQLIIQGSGFTASSTELQFDFSGPGLVFFQSANSIQNYLCFTGIGNCDISGSSSTLSFGTTVGGPFGALERYQGSDLSGVQTVATASVQPSPVPLPAGFPLLAAGMIGLVALARRKKAA